MEKPSEDVAAGHVLTTLVNRLETVIGRLERNQSSAQTHSDSTFNLRSRAQDLEQNYSSILEVPGRRSVAHPLPRVGIIQWLIFQRSERNRFFSADIFRDPAWDILLDLTLAEIKQQQISISSACLAAQVPPTTALRHIEELEKLGLIERENDPTDKRRRHIKLTNEALRAMANYFQLILQETPSREDLCIERSAIATA
ncbi:winged helix DNA-binding protein [Altericroceibacterium endophyticum]|uniref:Winged helix DNA-binding protein n=1 Tax=Altericroceibacterium endophyticum TaxID=1808508 RepID=A0A6I4T1U2_9SPHN|nr:winged helix DNA-binding protein [Altericroceibacterium endophyticum]MXO64858.1 winged helix DNA-binding protein [Altericroceibacterium endophyticum]